MEKGELPPYDWISQADLIHWTRKRNDAQDVHHISNIVVKHDDNPQRGRWISDYKRRFPNKWNDHVNLNSETSPNRAAGVLSGLKQQQQQKQEHMQTMDGRSYLASKR